MDTTDMSTSSVLVSLKDILSEHTSNLTEQESGFKIPVHALNPHLICGLCQGYLYEACTITECMHSFCKSCLVKHLQRSLNCPMCAIVIHPTDPFVNIRLDGLLQDIVYALLPQVEKVELEQERLFYEKHGGLKKKEMRRRESKKSSQLSGVSSPPKPSFTYNTYTSPVALSLQCVESNDKSHELEKQFVRVAGAATVEHLAEFLRQKLHITDARQVDVYCPQTSGRVCLNSSHTMKAVKDLYCHDQTIVRLNYVIKES